ncbi:MAG: VTT domain-containing protein [bacterium]
MHHLFGPIYSFVDAHSVLAYFVLFLGVFWEGEISLIIAGVLVHLQMLSPVFVVPIIILAALSKTILGYYVGEYVGKKFPNSKFLKFFERKVLYFLPRFKEKPFWSIFLSKCIYGANNATIVFAGYVGVDFKKYFKAEFFSSLIWLGIMFGLGLFFSATALSWNHGIRTFVLTVLIFIILFMFVQKLINLFIEIFEDMDSDMPTSS